MLTSFFNFFSADGSSSASALGYDAMYIDTGADVSKYLSASVFRVFVIYFLAACTFRFTNYPVKMQAANSSETSITSNQYIRRHIPEYMNFHKKGTWEPEFCYVDVKKLKGFLSPQHDGIWGSRSIAPLILNLGPRWRWVVKFMPWPLWLSKGAPAYQCPAVRYPKITLALAIHTGLLSSTERHLYFSYSDSWWTVIKKMLRYMNIANLLYNVYFHS